MQYPIFTHSSVDGHWGYLHVLAFVNSATMNIYVHVSIQNMVFSTCMPRNGIAGSYGSSICLFFLFLRKICAVLQGEKAILPSAMTWMDLIVIPNEISQTDKDKDTLLLMKSERVSRSVMSNSFWLHWPHQPPLSMGFPRQEYWSVLPLPSPGYLPNPEVEPRSPRLHAYSLPSEPPGKPISHYYLYMEFQENGTNEPILKTEIQSQMLKTNLWLPRVKGWAGGRH